MNARVRVSGLACTLAATLVGGLSLLGCAASPPATFYTLRPLPAADGRGATSGGAIGIGLGPVTFPTALDRPQIVSRDGANGLVVDEFNRWGGTLQDDFLRVWSENLGYLLGTSRIVIFPSEVRYPLDFRVSADVLTFEGTPTGAAVLKVRWAVLDPRLEQALAVRETSYRQALRQGADRGALIAAMSAALGAFSEDVAAVVRGLPKPAPPTPSPLY
ncbi:membrane integrity-associated transporter subunit PqiC [uncultured Thiodictyon sp.]|uniref:PqiC family protein n=1 Tax=uncultured Thiodictyon sp. TaxID=1846217 RepID=UPI0025F187F4|nr:PqiC family protein [uncultured Thiodictyon sp.]